MKVLLIFSFLFLTNTAFPASWSYQVNINGKSGDHKNIDSSKNSFEAGPHFCEVTPVFVNNNTEYRSLFCSVGTGTVSTGGLCTRKGSKVASVQYAILNLNGPKNVVNVVVSCKFD